MEAINAQSNNIAHEQYTYTTVPTRFVEAN